MKNTNTSVVTTALANLNSGNSVEVEKVLRLTKAEVMDIVLDEVVAQLSAAADLASDKYKACEKEIEEKLRAYVADFTGLQPSSISSLVLRDATIGYARNKTKGKYSVSFSLTQMQFPKGVAYISAHERFTIPAPPHAGKLKKKCDDAYTAQYKSRDAVIDVKYNRSAFKSKVIKSLLSDHAEGRALLDGVKNVAKNLIAQK